MCDAQFKKNALVYRLSISVHLSTFAKLKGQLPPYKKKQALAALRPTQTRDADLYKYRHNSQPKA